MQFRYDLLGSLTEGQWFHKEKCFNPKLYTVKPANKGHPGEVSKVAFVHRWSLFGGSDYNM